MLTISLLIPAACASGQRTALVLIRQQAKNLKPEAFGTVPGIIQSQFAQSGIQVMSRAVMNIVVTMENKPNRKHNRNL
jgi:hypothetical protein